MAGNWGESFVRSMATMSDVFNKRELMARDEADRRLATEDRERRLTEEKKNQPILDETRKLNLELLKQKRADAFDSTVSQRLASAMDKNSKGLDLDPDEESAVLMATNKANNWMDASPEEIEKTNKNLRLVSEKIKTMQPAIMEAIKNKQPVTISREADPEMFNALDSLKAYGGAANKGTGRSGNEAKKSIEKITITPEGNMIPVLRVEEADGTVYFAPATVGRDASPDAPVLQIPIAMFGAKMQQELRFAETLDTLMKKYGHTEFGKMAETKRISAKNSESFLAGETAVHEFLANSPDKGNGINMVRATYMKAARSKAKELGVTLSQAELNGAVKNYVKGQEDEETEILEDGTIVRKDKGGIKRIISKPKDEKADKQTMTEAERLAEKSPDEQKKVLDAKKKLADAGRAPDKPEKPVREDMTPREKMILESDFAKKSAAHIEMLPRYSKTPGRLWGENVTEGYTEEQISAAKRSALKILRENGSVMEAEDELKRLLPEEYKAEAPKAPQKKGEPVEKGNIDYSTLPAVKNPDGTVSSVQSISVNLDGKEVLLPTIDDKGKKLTVDEAVARYKKTGKHLGKFNTKEEATEYAKKNHASMGNSDAMSLAGKKPGRYRVDGKVVKWDGKKIIQ